MKKYLVLLVIVVVALGVVGCFDKATQKEDKQNSVKKKSVEGKQKSKKNEIEIVRSAVQDTLLAVLEDKISLPEENNGIKYVEKTFELTKEVFSTVRIVVYKYDDENYMWREGYEGSENWGDRDFKEEAEAFRKTSFGFRKERKYPGGYYSMPGWVKKQGAIKLRIEDDFFKPAGSFTRTFATFINNYLIEIHYICLEGVDFIDYEDFSKGIVFNKQNQTVIEEIEGAIKELKYQIGK
ncbi:MAG: hypothetical protein ABIH69_04425 [bacterium]